MIALLQQTVAGEQVKKMLEVIGMQAHRDAIDNVCAFWAGREEAKTSRESVVAADIKAIYC